MKNKLPGDLKVRKNRYAAVAPSGNPLGELTALPQPLTGGDGANCTIPKNSTPGIGPLSFRPQNSIDPLALFRQLARWSVLL